MEQPLHPSLRPPPPQQPQQHHGQHHGQHPQHPHHQHHQHHHPQQHPHPQHHHPHPHHVQHQHHNQQQQHHQQQQQQQHLQEGMAQGGHPVGVNPGGPGGPPGGNSHPHQHQQQLARLQQQQQQQQTPPHVPHPLHPGGGGGGPPGGGGVGGPHDGRSPGAAPPPPPGAPGGGPGPSAGPLRPGVAGMPALHGPPHPPPALHVPMSPVPFPFPPPFSPAMAHGFGPERLRGLHPPVLTHAAQRVPPPLVPMATAFPGFQEMPRMAGPLQFAGFMFSQEDLDMTLYGYARNKSNEQLPGHALSGLRIGELSYGIDRILGNGSASLHPSLKSGSSSGPIDPSTLDLPEGIELFQTTFAGAIHYGVFCRKTVITKGSVFGPFRGKQVNTSEIKTNDDNSFMWEIFQEGKLAHFIDGRGSAGNWMAYVNCARYAQEQNLLAVQTDGEIYYEACKDIPQGTELLVWYGDCYLQFMGIPVALKEMADGSQTEEIENSEGYQCERCGKVFAYRYYRDKHLKYTRCVDQGDRKFPCHLCTRSFEKRDRLRIHILHVHEKHRPHKCSVCGKSFSQSSSLNKHMRVHSGERPYKCVYCSKAFTASSILRTHIRQHSGEKPFKCRHCGKAFASHAAHDSHVRRTHTKDKPCVCSVCGKSFSQAYELKFHMNMHSGDNPQPLCCDRCGQRFPSPQARDRHVGSYQCARNLALTQSSAHRPGSADSHVMDLSHADVKVTSSRGVAAGQRDINMNVSEKALEEPIDVVGLDMEEMNKG